MRLVARSLFLVTILSAPATSQIVLQETLTDRAVWAHVGGAVTVTECSRFGKVDKLGTTSRLLYTRQAVTLEPGVYRAQVRHKKTTPKDKQRLIVKACYDVPLVVETTAATAIRVGEWQLTKSLSFELSKSTSVIFVFGNSDNTKKSDWLFDSFRLERLAFNGDSAGDGFGTSVSGAGDVNGDGFADVIVGGPLDDNNTKSDSGSARVLSGKDGKVLFTFDGDSAGDGFGSSVSGAGDVNGDGFADVIVGMPFDDNNTNADSGSARVFSGKDGKVLYTFDGDSAGDGFGTSVSGAGDVNGDGFADVIVGMPLDDNNTNTDSGSARVYSGKDGKILYTFDGDSAGDGFGSSVSGAGDVNGDGFADVIVGMPLDDNNTNTDSGSARVLSGKDGAVLYTFDGDSAGDAFGTSVSGAGDVNGDGSADVIVGAPLDDNNTKTDSGSARVFSGKDGKVLFTFDGDSAGDAFGSSVSGVGDVNGDNCADVVVGAPLDDNRGTDSGSARVFSGKDGKAIVTVDGQTGGARFGASVSIVGDANCDGFADVAVGAPQDGNIVKGRGRIRLVFSEAVTHRAGPAFDGDSAGDTFGTAVSAAGDVNGDGFGDVIVGAQGDDNNTKTDSGSARVLSGKDGKILYTFDGDSAGDEFGSAVSGAGDVNGDGFADVIVGARGDDNKGTGSGSARVLSGKDGKILYTFDGDSAGDALGRSVSGAGDVNGDGVPDVIVGAPGDDNNGQTDSGSARVFSGKDGSILFTFNGDGAQDFFGNSVSGAGDVNGDGFADLVVGAYGDDNNGRTDSGSVRVFSGKDGKVLMTVNGDSAGDSLGWSVSGAGDVNGDGRADVIAGAPLDDNGGGNSGSARVYSGKGGVLFTVDGEGAGDLFGQSVSGAGDVNGDGFADVIVGASRDDNNALVDSGSARVVSGRDGKVLHTFNGDSKADWFGFSVSGAGDVNCDGLADLIVGAFLDSNNAVSSGSARLFLSRRYTTPGLAKVYGRPCSDSTGRLARIGVIGLPQTGGSFTVTLSSAPANAPALLAIGGRVDFPFGGCRLLAFPLFLVPHKTGAIVTSQLAAIPNKARLVGFRLATQWAIEDPVNKALFTSDGLELEVGSPLPK